MISWVFGSDYLWIDLLMGGLGEVMVAIVILYALSNLSNWLYDFNGAMRIYRQMKKPTKGGIK